MTSRPPPPTPPDIRIAYPAVRLIRTSNNKAIACRALFKHDATDIRGIITSARKGAAKSRPLPLHPQLSELLQQWRREDGHKADLIIHYEGRSVKSIKTGFACTKLESCLTRRIRPYNFSHAPITTMLLGGKDIQTVSALAGHSNPTTTARV